MSLYLQYIRLLNITVSYDWFGLLCPIPIWGSRQWQNSSRLNTGGRPAQLTSGVPWKQSCPLRASLLPLRASLLPFQQPTVIRTQLGLWHQEALVLMYLLTSRRRQVCCTQGIFKDYEKWQWQQWASARQWKGGTVAHTELGICGQSAAK